MPDLRLESGLREKGFGCVAGVDEAGRGPLAGPLVVAAVVLPHGWRPEVPVDDCKRLSPEAREKAFAVVRRDALAWRMTTVQAAEIDRLNILGATLAGMRRVVERMRPQPDYVLVDGNRLPQLTMPCEAVVKGDQRSLSIAAASVLAKVARDRIMRVYGGWYPQWGFERHKGYGTAMHLEAIGRHGRSPIHRESFRVRGAGMNARGRLGKRGEAIAARYLEGLGFRIEERNFRCALGEIDLIATSGEYLIFVEVKARTAGHRIHPAASVTPKKQAKVRQVGEYFCAQHPRYTQQPRFDVIAVEVSGEKENVEHIVNAF